MRATLYCFFLAATCIGRSTAGMTEEVEELLNAGEELDFNGATDLIIILGSTGVGKSTLAKFITHDPSLQVIQAGNSYVFKDNGTISIVTSKSMTLLPNVYKDTETGQILVDCPGFSDTREPKFEIATSFFIKKVMEYAKRVKIVLAENHFSLMTGNDRFGLTRLLKHISELIPNIDHFRGSMVLIATKVINQGISDEAEKEDIISFCSEFARDLRIEISNHKHNNASYQRNRENLLKALDVINGDGTGTNLDLFRKPNQVGSPWDSPMLLKLYNDIRDSIFQRTPWVDNTNQSYHYTLTMESIVFIKEHLMPNNNINVIAELSKIIDVFTAGVATKLNDTNLNVSEKFQLSTGFKNKFIVAVANIKSLSDLTNIGTELSEFVNMSNIDHEILAKLVYRTTFFNDVGGINSKDFLAEVKKRLIKTETVLENMNIFYQFLQGFETQLDTFSPQSVRHTAIKKVLKSGFRRFIFEASKHHFQIAKKSQLLAISLTDYMLNDLNRILHTALEYPVNIVHDQKTNHLLVEARNVLASEVNAKLGAYPGLSSLTLIAAKHFFLDQNLTLINTHVNIVAPEVEVIGNREITLVGSDASPPGKVADSPSPGVPGTDGHAGYPGTNSGNFVLVALDVIGASQLKIKSVGGRGSRGQNGGNGRAGVASYYPPMGEIIMDSSEDVDNFIRGQGFGFDRTGDAFIVINQKQNVLPSSGGAGGVGGQGGRAGNIFIKVRNQASGNPIKLAQIAGNQGEGGDGGAGGVGMAQCKRKHFSCRFQEKKGSCDMWYRRKTCVKSRDYFCGSNNLDNCDNYPNAAGGGKGVSTVGAQVSLPLVPIFFNQLWFNMNETVAPFQPLGGDYNDLLQYAQQEVLDETSEATTEK